MSLAPLLDAAPAIPLHAFAAMTAFALGLVQFAAPKGTLPHRTLRWIWALQPGRGQRARPRSAAGRAGRLQGAARLQGWGLIQRPRIGRARRRIHLLSI